MNSHIKCFTEQRASYCNKLILSYFTSVSQWMEITYFTKTWRKSLHDLRCMKRQETREEECNMCHICRDMGFGPCLKDERFMMGWESRRL